MKVHLIVEREHGSHWILDAVDEWTIDEWNGKYPDSFEKKLKVNPSGTRILVVEIPDDAMERAFDTPVVKGEVVE